MTLLFKYILKQNECYFNYIYQTGLTFGKLSLKPTYLRQQYDVEIHHLKIGYQFERRTINRYVDKNRKRVLVLINFATTMFALITVQTSVLLLIRD